KLADPIYAAKAFYGINPEVENPGLDQIEGWTTMSPTEAAQSVQRAALPDAYEQWETLADELLGSLTDVEALDCTTATSIPASLGSGVGGSGLTRVRRWWVPADCPVICTHGVHSRSRTSRRRGRAAPAQSRGQPRGHHRDRRPLQGIGHALTTEDAARPHPW